MAVVYPLIKSESIEGCSYANFLSKEVAHLVSPDGNELVFEDIRKESLQRKPMRTRILASGTVHKVLRISGKAFPDNSLDALLIYSRSTKTDSQTSVEDILSIYRFNSETSELDFIKSDVFTATPSALPIPNDVVISVNEHEGNNIGSIIFSNGSPTKLHIIHPTRETETLPLTTKLPSQPAPSKVFWISSNFAVAVIVSRFTSTLELIDLESVKSKGKQKHAATKTVPEIVKYIGRGTSENTFIVMFSTRFMILSLTKKGFKEEKEFQCDVKTGVKSWYFLMATQDGAQFYISSAQDLLMIRKSGGPTLLQIQDGIPGHLAPLGSGLFAIKSKEVIQFCQFRLNRKKTNVLAEFINSRVLPPTDLELLNQSVEKHMGKQFWWRHSIETDKGMVVCQQRHELAADVVSTPFDGSVSGIWSTENKNCFLVSGNGASYLAQLEGHSLVTLTKDSWQCLTEESIYADENVQVTSSEISWRMYGRQKLPEKCNLVEASKDFCVVASNESAFVYRNGKVVKSIKLEDTILSLSCSDRCFAILTSQEIHIFNEISGNSQVQKLETFCTAVLVTSDDKVFVGTSSGNVISVSDSNSFHVSFSAIQKMFNSPNPGTYFIVDAHTNTFSVDTNCKVNLLSKGFKNVLIPTEENYLTVSDRMVKTVAFPGETSVFYDSCDIPSFQGADKITFLAGKFYGLYWNKREVHMAHVHNILKPTKHTLPRGDQEPGDKSQLYVLSGSRILEVVATEPEDMGSDSELEDDDAAIFFEVPVKLRLYTLNPGKKQLEKLSEVKLTLPGDPYDEIIVKFIHSPETSTQRFYVFCQSSSSAFGVISPESNEIKIRASSPHHSEDVYYDHWLVDESSQELLVVGQNGEAALTSVGKLSEIDVPALDLISASEYEVSKIVDFTDDMVYQVIELRCAPDDSRVLAASVKQNPTDKFSRVLIFRASNRGFSRIADLIIPNQRISLVKAISVGINEAFSPDLYVGAGDGSLYAVSLLNDSQTYTSLKNVQTTLLQEMGFADRLEQLRGTLDGELLSTALHYPEFHELFHNRRLDITELTHGLSQMLV